MSMTHLRNEICDVDERCFACDVNTIKGHCAAPTDANISERVNGSMIQVWKDCLNDWLNVLKQLDQTLINNFHTPFISQHCRVAFTELMFVLLRQWSDHARHVARGAPGALIKHASAWVDYYRNTFRMRQIVIHTEWALTTKYRFMLRVTDSCSMHVTHCLTCTYSDTAVGQDRYWLSVARF